MSSDQIKEINKKVDKLDERLDNIDKTLIRQQESLDHHIYRTDQNEQSIEKITETLVELQTQSASTVSTIKTSYKILIAISTILGIMFTAMRIFGI